MGLVEICDMVSKKAYIGDYKVVEKGFKAL